MPSNSGWEEDWTWSVSPEDALEGDSAENRGGQWRPEVSGGTRPWGVREMWGHLVSQASTAPLLGLTPSGLTLPVGPRFQDLLLLPPHWDQHIYPGITLSTVI